MENQEGIAPCRGAEKRAAGAAHCCGDERIEAEAHCRGAEKRIEEAAACGAEKRIVEAPACGAGKGIAQTAPYRGTGACTTEAASRQTLAVHAGSFAEPTGSVSVPIYQTATFSHPGLGRTTGYDYSRQKNPTREAAENAVARLEGARYGFAFSTGMAAVNTVLELFSPGDHLVVSEDLYGGTWRLFNDLFVKYGLSFTPADTSDPAATEAAVRPDTAAFFIETPTNPMMKVTDLARLRGIARRHGLLTIVDNTFLTPYFQRPIGLGADIVVHSGTKFLCGHNDTLAGFAVTDDEALAEKLCLLQISQGAVLSPFDSWLTLRGIKTLAVRLEKQQENALALASRLAAHPGVSDVYYVGLPSHPGYRVMKRQASGFGSMISFKVREPGMVEQFLGGLKLVTFAESLGGVESLVTYPLLQTHQAVPDALKQRLGIDDRLLRLSVGIEAAADIWDDLRQALDNAAKVVA